MYQLVINEKRGKIRELGNLPVFPAIAQQIMAQITDEHVDIPRLSKTIEQDPVVFGKIIGVANSAYFGCPDKIYTISHAIVRVLGLCMVKSLALGMVLNEPFKGNRCPGFSMERYWFNSLLTALIAQRLARYIKFGQRDFQDRAYLAGMLSNLGELVLSNLFPSEMNDVYLRVHENTGDETYHIQKDIVGISSSEACAILAQRWPLPKDLQNMYTHFHQADYDGEHWQLLHLIRLCSQLVKHEDLADALSLTEVKYSLDKLGLTEGQVNKLQQKISNDRQDVENLAEICAQA